LQIGVGYSMAAKAATGFGFVNWTDGMGNILTNGLTLKFIMASNLNFVANFRDITKPTLTITNPVKTGLKWSNEQYTVMGKCGDNVGVSNVWLSVNGGAWMMAAVSGTGSNWMQQVDLVPGTNTFAAYAVDAAGNVSLTNTTKLIYVLTAPLMVSITGQGTITPNYNGANLAIGTGYSMTAKAAAGSGFVSWTDGMGNIITNGLILKFTMASNLNFVANFIDITKPTLTITDPVANQKWSNNVLFTVTGKCSDNMAVSNVLVSLNGAGWQPVASFNLGDTNWMQQVTLVPGTNTIAAFAVDGAGNVSLTNTVTFVYIPDTRVLFGMWNMVQFQTPAQVYFDTNNDLQGGGSSAVTTGSMMLFTNGTLSGQLGEAFTGSFIDNSNGTITATIMTADSTNDFTFVVNASRSTMTEVDTMFDDFDNQQEIVMAQRVPPSLTMADVAGTWNLAQMHSPAQIYYDTNSMFQGGDSFSETNGTLTLTTSGTFTAHLEGSASGTFTISSNGIVTLHLSSGGDIVLFCNFYKDTMVEVSSQFDANDNQQEIVVGHRPPASLTAAAVAGSWNLVQFSTPAQIYFDTNNFFQGGVSFGVGTGTMTVNANGTMNGVLGDPFNGTFTVSSGGTIHATINGQVFSFHINSSGDTMTEVDTLFDSMDNHQEMTIAHRVPAN
jgi:hypothetical protein